jgi:hypothetical protein
MKSSSTQQGERILKALQESNGQFIPMPELSRIGSGKPDGWVASFTKRISELRAKGHPIELMDERVNGQRQTKYRYVANCQ